MKKHESKPSKGLQSQATQIAADIFQLASQYTNDSATSKFFLPEEVSQSLYITAGSFASVVYRPQLELEDIQKSTILPLFLVLTTYGFQIYVKERSIRTNAAPYRIPIDEEMIKDASQKVLGKAIEGQVLSTPLADQVIEIILQQIHKNLDIDQYIRSDAEFDEQKAFNYMTIALYYGYNLAAVLINK